MKSSAIIRLFSKKDFHLYLIITVIKILKTPFFHFIH